MFLIPGILAFLLIILFPLLANIGISFTEWEGIGKPDWIGLTNYIKAFGDATFWGSFKNNLIIAIVITIVPSIIGLLLAAFIFEYISIKFGSRISSFFRAGFYLPQIIPVVVSGVVWRWLLQPNWGVVNQFLNNIGLKMLAHNWLGDKSTALASIIIMTIWFQVGYPLVIFIAALQRIDPVLYEAAELDGASWRQRFFYITVNLIRPEIFVVVITTIVFAFKVFGQVFVMTRGGPGRATIVASYFSYINFFDYGKVGYGATISTVLTIIILLITAGLIMIQIKQERSS